jgi:hypothetical protein
MNSCYLLIKLIFVFFISTNLIYANTAFIPIGSHNTEFAVIFSHSFPTSIELISKMSLAEITKLESKEQTIINKALVESVKSSLYPLLQQMNFSEQNLSQLLILSGEQFINDLVKKIKNELSKGTIEQDYSIKLMISPIRSEKLNYRHSTDLNNDRTRIFKSYPYFSKDKFPLYDLAHDNAQEISTENGLSKTAITNGVNTYLDEVYIGSGASREVINPFFVSTQFIVNLRKIVDDSSIEIKSVVGMPTKKQPIPFTEQNEKIKFTHISQPQVNLQQNSFGVFSIKAFPAAVIAIDIPLNPEKPKFMHISFGPLAEIKNGSWVTVDQKEKSGQLVPKLVGNPKIKNKDTPLEAEFNIYSLSIDLKTQRLADLSLYLSLGTKRIIPNLGHFSIKSVNEEFKNEINKTIELEVSKVKNKATNALNTTDVSSALGLVEKLFNTQN